MTQFVVRWEIDIEADDERGAAEKAFAIQRNLESTATVFLVGTTQAAASDCWTVVDLDEEYW